MKDSLVLVHVSSIQKAAYNLKYELQKESMVSLKKFYIDWQKHRCVAVKFA